MMIDRGSGGWMRALRTTASALAFACSVLSIRAETEVRADGIHSAGPAIDLRGPEVAAAGSEPQVAPSIGPDDTASAERDAHSATWQPVTERRAAPSQGATAQGRIFVEVARFRSHADASRFGRRVAKQVPDLRHRLKVTGPASGDFSVRAGPFGDRMSARQLADTLQRDLKLKPVIVTE